ncbi:Peroxisomal membrane protein PMP27 [Irineochytrium annulatum]|nr:Peroxisomal membrane protein PMP27 [Irineochytrium annulatum]
MSDKLVKFLSTTVGRDRINRFVQYALRYVIWQLQRTGGEKDTIQRFTKLQAALGQTRKVMRTGRQVEFYRTIVKSMAVRDSIVKNTTVAKNVFLSLWLGLDTLQWMHGAGFIRLEGIKDIGRRAFQFWLGALLCSFVGDLHKLRVNSQRMRVEMKSTKTEGGSAEGALKALKAERQKIVLATVQDGLDILIPASGLEYIKIESGLVGLAGAITSVIGGYTHWNSL